MSDITMSRQGEVAWIRLNREDRMNAYDAAMANGLIKAIDSAADSGVIVITGTGKAFCAGGYLPNLAEAKPAELRALYTQSLALFDTIRQCRQPVIAAVNGAAVGGGNELVVTCDLAIAAESAYFGQTGPRIGSSPILGGTNLLAMSIGEKRAKEVVYLCRRYPAGEAFQMGWVNSVVPDSELVETTQKWAEELLALSPRYLEISKFSSNAWYNLCRESYLSGIGMLIQAIGSEDMVEGASAFLEKRKPKFRRS